MNIVVLSLCIGIVAGIIDIIPMMIQKLSKRSIISAFIQYFFVSIIILNIDLFGIAWWLQGGIISIALSLPVLIIVSEKDKKVIPIILTMAVILGTGICVAGHFLK